MSPARHSHGGVGGWHPWHGQRLAVKGVPFTGFCGMKNALIHGQGAAVWTSAEISGRFSGSIHGCRRGGDGNMPRIDFAKL